MELQVLDIQRLPAAMLGEAARKVGDRVNELVRDVEEQLVCIHSDVTGKLQKEYRG